MGRARAWSLLARRIKPMLRLLLLQPVPSFCEHPPWCGVWRSAVLGAKKSCVWSHFVSCQCGTHTDTQSCIWHRKRGIDFLCFICTYHFTDLGCEVQIDSQQLPYRDKRILFSYIQLLLLRCTVDTEIKKKKKRHFTYPASSSLIYAVTVLQKKYICF